MENIVYTCSICLFPYSPNNIPLILSCGHTFCKVCMLTQRKKDYLEYSEEEISSYTEDDDEMEAGKCMNCRTYTNKAFNTLPINLAVLNSFPFYCKTCLSLNNEACLRDHKVTCLIDVVTAFQANIGEIKLHYESSTAYSLPKLADYFKEFNETCSTSMTKLGPVDKIDLINRSIGGELIFKEFSWYVMAQKFELTNPKIGKLNVPGKKMQIYDYDTNKLKDINLDHLEITENDFVLFDSNFKYLVILKEVDTGTNELKIMIHWLDDGQEEIISFPDCFEVIAGDLISDLLVFCHGESNGISFIICDINTKQSVELPKVEVVEVLDLKLMCDKLIVVDSCESLSILVFDKLKWSWKKHESNFKFDLKMFGMVCIDERTIMLFGGLDSNEDYSSECFFIDIETGKVKSDEITDLEECFVDDIGIVGDNIFAFCSPEHEEDLTTQMVKLSIKEMSCTWLNFEKDE